MKPMNEMIKEVLSKLKLLSLDEFSKIDEKITKIEQENEKSNMVNTNF